VDAPLNPISDRNSSFRFTPALATRRRPIYSGFVLAPKPRRKDMDPKYHGDFVWHELMSKDVKRSIAFFTELFGWTTQDHDMGPMGTYTMLFRNGAGFGGAMTIQHADHPSHWMGYIGTGNVDEATARIQRMGGKVAVPPTDIPNAGRFSVVSDPQGAWFALYKSADMPPDPSKPMHDRQEVGGFAWSELMTTDIEGAKAFYAENFNWKPGDAMPFGPGGYHFMMRGENPICGLFQKPDEVPVPNWTHYVRVEDADATFARATSLGASVMMPPETVPGMVRFAVLADPTGAVFGIFHSIAPQG
jgi:predicted enzyme related to lactoylglutathione lyase